MKTTLQAILILVFALLVVGIAAAQESQYISNPVAPFLPSSWDMNCTTMVVRYNVDPVAAANIVPQGYTIKINQDHATLMLVVEDCSNILVNGFLETGKAVLAHAWIQIEGQFERKPVDGAIFTHATQYWCDLRGQTDNRLLAATMMLTGLPVTAVDKITLGDIVDGIRLGGVVERQHPSQVGFTWVENTQASSFPPGFPPPPIPIGVNHRVYAEHPGPAGTTIVSATIQCLCSVSSQGTSVLSADTNSLIGILGFGTTLSASPRIETFPDAVTEMIPGAVDFTHGCKAQFQMESSN